jgi:serine/threonine protein kinase
VSFAFFNYIHFYSDDRFELIGTVVGLDPKIFFFFLAVVDPLHARYLIAHKLASGGFGDVYAGVRKKDGMPVALKVVPKKRMREINTVRYKSQKKIFFFL